MYISLFGTRFCSFDSTFQTVIVKNTAAVLNVNKLS